MRAAALRLESASYGDEVNRGEMAVALAEGAQWAEDYAGRLGDPTQPLTGRIDSWLSTRHGASMTELLKSLTTRLIGFLLLAAAAVAVTIMFAPEQPKTPMAGEFRAQINAALADWESNEARTDTAPKQQVVNGWVARDLLEVIARENAVQLENSAPPPPDRRIPWLLTILVGAVGWHGLTHPTGSEEPTGSGGDEEARTTAGEATGQDPTEEE